MAYWRPAYRYLSGHVALTISEALYDFAFAAMAFKVSGNAMVGGSAYAVGYIAEILVSLFAGGILDRFDRRKVFGTTMVLKSTSFLVFLAIATLTSSTNLSALTICAFAFVIDLLHHCARLANTVTLYQIFDGTERTRVQGLSTTVNGIGRIMGPALASALAWTLGPSTHLILWPCLLLQAAAWLALKPTFPKPKPGAKDPPDFSLKFTLFETLATIKFAIYDRSWRRFFVANAIATVLLGTANLLFFPFLKNNFGLEDAECGTIFSAGAAGSILGGVFFNRAFTASSSHQRNSLIGLFLAGFALANMSSGLFGLISIMILVAVFQIGLVIFFRSSALLLAENVHQSSLGRWWTANDAVSRIAGLTGVLGGASLMDAIGGARFYASLGIAIMALAVMMVTMQSFNLINLEKEQNEF